MLPKDSSPHGPSNRTLYHYTTLDAFYKIIDKGYLWATDARFLNDTNELKSVKDILTTYERYWNTTRPDPPYYYVAQNIISTAIGMLEQNRLPPIYVTSFSTQADQLAQWSGYSASGTGVCFGISERAIKKTSSQSGFALFNCDYVPRYEPDYSPGMLKGLEEIIYSYEHKLEFGWIDQPENALELIQQELASERYSEFLEKRLPEIPNHLATTKDDSWKDEHEVRAVLATSSLEGIEFRTNGMQLIPYKKLPLPTHDEKLLIESICYWASPAPSETEIALKTLRDMKGIKSESGRECAVIPSKNPFRPRLK